jgi:hypothetical protein
MFTVVGIANDGVFGHADVGGHLSVLSALWVEGLQAVKYYVPDDSFLPRTDCGLRKKTNCTALFSEKNDRIVTRTSQGNSSTGAGNPLQGVDHMTVLNSGDAINNKVKEILELP